MKFFILLKNVILNLRACFESLLRSIKRRIWEEITGKSFRKAVDECNRRLMTTWDRIAKNKPAIQRLIECCATGGAEVFLFSLRSSMSSVSSAALRIGSSSPQPSVLFACLCRFLINIMCIHLNINFQLYRLKIDLIFTRLLNRCQDSRDYISTILLVTYIIAKKDFSMKIDVYSSCQALFSQYGQVLVVHRFTTYGIIICTDCLQGKCNQANTESETHEKYKRWEKRNRCVVNIVVKHRGQHWCDILQQRNDSKNSA